MTAKSVIITGASDGIGRCLARAFASRGFSVGLIARREALLANVAAECRELGAPAAEFIPVDVTRSAAFREALGELDSRLGGAGIFIANAGVDCPQKPGRDMGERALLTIDVNVRAAIDGIEFMKPRLVERGGRIAGVSSVAGARGLPGFGIYSASKAAIAVYLESLRIELRRFGVSVTDVAPGFIATEMTRDSKFPMPFLMKPDRAAEVFVKAILKGRALIVAPRPYRVAYSILKLTPGWLYRLLVSFF